MVFITEDLIRKRAEHNNLEISTLEEVSLHQQDIERIEYIDKWCRELKILYLQSNLIPRIENVTRLKKLEYINLALNNIERIENLEGCESLRKLDLTVNFVGELTSIENLKGLEHFEELYLTGNPCVDFEGYRQYVIATLPNLKQLDGSEIEKSERIKAMQEYDTIRPKILQQQMEYCRKREAQRVEAAAQNQDENQTKNRDETLKKFNEEAVPYTPETRIKMHEEIKELKKKENGDEEKAEKKPRRFFGDDGRVLNINEPKIDFKITENEDENTVVLELAVWKHLDTSFLDIDVQPTYVRVTVKGKIVQLALPDEVCPDKSKASRSQITGALLVSMPKLHGEPRKNKAPTPVKTNLSDRGESNKFLEFSNENPKNIDIANIVSDKKDQNNFQKDQKISKKIAEQSQPLSNEEFVDDPEVPPLI